MDPSTPNKETKVKIRKPRQPKAEGSTRKDKTIKIKLTTKKSHHTEPTNGSEEEDDPETAHEEHMIFRVPEGELCDKLHEVVKKREISEDVKLNLKGKLNRDTPIMRIIIDTLVDNRKGTFTFDGRKYDLQVVDLPTVIESQKTLDKKQFYKVADISQVKIHGCQCKYIY